MARDICDLCGQQTLKYEYDSDGSTLGGECSQCGALTREGIHATAMLRAQVEEARRLLETARILYPNLGYPQFWGGVDAWLAANPEPGGKGETNE